MINTIKTDNKESVIRNWVFSKNEYEELALAESVASLAKKTGVSVNELQHLFPASLKMLNSDSSWTK